MPSKGYTTPRSQHKVSSWDLGGPSGERRGLRDKICRGKCEPGSLVTQTMSWMVMISWPTARSNKKQAPFCVFKLRNSV